VKHLVAVTILLLSISSYSQTSLKLHAGASGALEQYMWSFSKNKVSSEKPLIDFEVMDNWKGMGSYLAVSDDGKYFAYTVNKHNGGFRMSPVLLIVDSLVIQSTKSDWRRAFAGAETGFFTADGKQYIFQTDEGLAFLRLGTGEMRNVKAGAYKMSKNEWMAYHLKGKHTVTLLNLSTGKEKIFSGIGDYTFDNSGEWLMSKNDSTNELFMYNLAKGAVKRFHFADAYEIAANGKVLLLKTKNSNGTALAYITLPQGTARTIWAANESTVINQYIIDASGQQIAFTVVDSVDAAKSGVYYYREGMEKAVLKINNHMLAIPAGSAIGGISFTDNNRYLSITEVKPVESKKAVNEIAGLDIWNHKDLYVQSAQVALSKEPKTYRTIVNIENGVPLLTESDDKKINLLRGEFAVVLKEGSANYGDRFWEQEKGLHQDSIWVVSLRDGKSSLLPTNSKRFWFSPSGNYLVYFDAKTGCHYYSYDLRTGVAKDISYNVPENQLGLANRSMHLDKKPEHGNLAAWIEKDAGVFVYENYDIWKLDLTGQQAAVNITNGFGQRNTTILNMFSSDRYYGETPTIKTNESLVLRGYNTENKQNGFYRKIGVNVGTPTELFTGGYMMKKIWGCHYGNMSNDGMAPLKAKNANTWIVQRQSTNDAPNYYATSDFKTFKRLTNLQPQKSFQWLSEELHSFKHLNGKMGQGILYKPDNFDPAKKYPVLIVFYQNFSDNSFQFHVPAGNFLAVSPGDSPNWLLNNGFLVFTPDMHITPLKLGPSGFNVLEGAAQYLKTIPYVDGNKLGCAGHSWSGKFGAYLLTHSTSFGATAISAAFAYGNLISTALSNNSDGTSRLGATEIETGYGSLWTNKEAWLDQTTVLQADKAESPLLLLCGKLESIGAVDDTRQFFNALRRLEKKVWWLAYDEGSHALADPKLVRDYTLRYTQFFDHYLKEAPAPLWMTQGIPYRLKGESRYELDPNGTCNSTNGEPCLVCQAWNKQYKKTPEMFQKEIKDWALDKEIVDEMERKQNEKRKELNREGTVRTKEVLQMLNAK
jgi:dienelactone hydrolase